MLQYPHSLVESSPLFSKIPSHQSERIYTIPITVDTQKSGAPDFWTRSQSISLLVDMLQSEPFFLDTPFKM